MKDPFKKEPNFIEKKKQWKSSMEKPLGRRTLMMVLPALILCVFVMMAAPYVKILVEKMMQGGEELNVTVPLNLEEVPEKKEKPGPPPSPEQAQAQFYRDQFDKEGFDWRTKPEIEGPDLSFAKDREVEVEPVDVELPVTMTQLKAAEERADAASATDAEQ